MRISSHVLQASSANSTDTPGARLLVVDDEHSVRTALARFLRSRGYQVEVAENGADALGVVEQWKPDLVLTDVRMPGMSGLELVPRILRFDRNTAVLILSAVNDAPTARGALADGALDYLTKPVELPELQEAVERALRRRRLSIERQRVEELIREEVAARTDELEQEKRALRELTIGIAESLTNAMEAKDQYLRGHSQRVADLAASLAHALQLDVDTVESVRIAARIMDVGRIGIREAVMNKPGPLTEEEFEHVKDHVRIGMEILSPLKHLGPALQFVQDHHERLDGRGYPRGLRGNQISIGGRILAAADAFCALTSERAFRGRKSPQEALTLLGEQAGDFIDPAVYSALSTLVQRRKSLVFIEAAQE